MSEPVVIFGTVLPDGSVQLARPVPLPPGPVEVEVRPIPATPGDGMLDALARIDAARASWPDYAPRRAEEIAASIREMRDGQSDQSRLVEKLLEGWSRTLEGRSSSGAAP